MMISHIEFVVHGWSGGLHPASCVTKSTTKTLMVSSIEWWFEKHCCIEQSIDQTRTLGSEDVSGGHEDVEVNTQVY